MNNVDQCYRADLFILENKVAAKAIKKFSVSLAPAGLLQCSGELFNLSPVLGHINLTFHQDFSCEIM